MKTLLTMRILARKWVLLLGATLVASVVVAGGCKSQSGGNAGDRCNPLVLRDECDDGLHCKAATCSESYCCPISASSSDPHCNAAGCPDTADASDVDASDVDAGIDADAAGDH